MIAYAAELRQRLPDMGKDCNMGTIDFRGHDLLGMEDLTPAEICFILDAVPPFKEVSEREIKKVPTLRGKTIIDLFFEPSTRTRTSFEIAGKRLSADALAFT